MATEPRHDSARAVVFDLDGVIIDSTETHFAAWRQVCRESGRELTREEFLPSIGTGNDVTVKILFGADAGPECAALAERKERIYRDLMRQNPSYIDGAAELVTDLHEAGWRLALATSAPRDNVACSLEKFPAAELFAVKVNADMVAHSKPAPDIFLKAADLLGVRPENCVVVEDSIAGLEAAARAGMARVGLTTTIDLAELMTKADMVVDSLRDLTPESFAALLEAVS